MVFIRLFMVKFQKINISFTIDPYWDGSLYVQKVYLLLCLKPLNNHLERFIYLSVLYKHPFLLVKPLIHTKETESRYCNVFKVSFRIVPKDTLLCSNDTSYESPRFPVLIGFGRTPSCSNHHWHPVVQEIL